jgi:hypothetical protein
MPPSRISSAPVKILAPWNDRLAEPLDREHLVQLYREEGALVEALSLYAGHGLGKGEAVIIVATEAHRRAVAEHLARARFDVTDLERWGQLVFIDAARLLARLRVDGALDETRFHRIVGELLAAVRAGGRYPRVRVYGEMVNLLWRIDRGAARRLEELWNEILEREGGTLFCAYHLDGSAEAETLFPDDLRRLHSHVVPVAAAAV